MPNALLIGERLRTLRDIAGHDAETAALLAHVSKRNWLRFEAGEKYIPEDVVRRYCAALGVDPASVLR